jgi:long-chain acyl-CoA synthetase
VIIGDRRKFLSALLTLDGDAAERAVGSREASDHADIRAALDAHVSAINERFARVEHIRKFKILPREFDQENGELTPTLKIKRAIVYDNWSDTIDAFYEEVG